MNLGKAAVVIGIALNHNIERLERLVLLLETFEVISVEDLRNHLDGNREFLLIEALSALGVILPFTANGTYQGTVLKSRLNWFLDHLSFYFHAIQSSTEDYNNYKDVYETELGWTLPQQIWEKIEYPRPGSLEALIRYTISISETSLYLLSPFMDRKAAETLSGVIAGAYRRGVAINLISHGLTKPSSSTSEALEIYRLSAPNLRAYTAAQVVANGEDPIYFLLHAKLVIADNNYAVLSSANLTHYGLHSHLEVGLGVAGSIAKDLKRLLDVLVTSTLVELTP